MFGFVLVCCALLLAAAPLASAGDDALERPITTAAPLDIPHTTDELDARAAGEEARSQAKQHRESSVPRPGARPQAAVVWPKKSDVRARLVTPELRKTPVVGWIAENLYRSKKDNGWCLEVDPGEGEYVVFYRLNL